MGQFSFRKTRLAGLLVIEPKVFGDARGYFMETWNLQDFTLQGLPVQFVQDNQSKSSRGVLRGMHFQKQFPQGKLVRVISGEVFDVAVDLRKDSPTCGKWYGERLSEENKRMLYVPGGFAHGFLVLSETAEFVYKCTSPYVPEDEGGLRWDDSDIGIEWPLSGLSVQLSEKDAAYPCLRELPFRYERLDPWA